MYAFKKNKSHGNYGTMSTQKWNSVRILKERNITYTFEKYTDPEIRQPEQFGLSISAYV